MQRIRRGGNNLGGMELTDTNFWDDYWSKYKLPCKVDNSFSFDRCMARELKRLLTKCKGSVLEVGSAPGKWLAFLNQEIGLLPSGIEYSSVGNEKTIENFKLLGISNRGNLWEGDFLTIHPQQQFDVVMSLGFIEHFDNVEEIMRQHLLWVKPNGLLVIGIPNFKGIYYPIQRILDKTLFYKHNLDIMSFEFFRKTAEHFSLLIESLSYIGGFEPALPIAKPGIHNVQQFIVKGLLFMFSWIRRLRIFDNINNKYISSYILCVYKKVEVF